MIEYQTLTYIMYQENLEREKKDEEDRRRADEERKRKEEELKRREAQNNNERPQTRAEMLLAARRAREGIENPDGSQPVFANSSSGVPGLDMPMDEFVEMLEQEM